MKPRFLLFINANDNYKELVKVVARTAQENDAELYLLTIIDIEQIKEMIYKNIMDEHRAKIRETLEKINDLIYKYYPNLIVKTNIKEGLVIECISDFIKENSKNFKVTFLRAGKSASSVFVSIVSTIIKHSKATIVILPQEMPNSTIQKGIL